MVLLSSDFDRGENGELFLIADFDRGGENAGFCLDRGGENAEFCFDRGENTNFFLIPRVVNNLQALRDIDPGELINMSCFFAFEFTQAVSQSFRLNASARINIRFMSVTLDTSQLEMSPLKRVATANMPVMSVTLDTSHFEISPLNFVLANKWLMSVTLDTSHSPIGPSGPSEQSPLGDTFKYALIAAFSLDFVFGANTRVIAMAEVVSSDVGCGENTRVVVMAEVDGTVHAVCNIDPGEPLNMSSLVAFE